MGYLGMLSDGTEIRQALSSNTFPAWSFPAVHGGQGLAREEQLASSPSRQNRHAQWTAVIRKSITGGGTDPEYPAPKDKITRKRPKF